MRSTPLQRTDPPETVDLARENAKLRKINAALMRRVEQQFRAHDGTFERFQHAATLEEQVRARTLDLAEALDQLRLSNARLATARAEADKARTGLTDALEAVQEGFALFDGEDRLMMSNSRFCAALPDVRDRLTHGMPYRDYVRMVAESPHALRPGRSPSNHMGLRLARHGRSHVSFTIKLTGDRWLQVSEQRTPSQGTAVIQTDVTEMIQRERQQRDKLLDEQARMVRATLDHIRQGVANFDAGGCLVGWNRRLRELMLLPTELVQTGTRLTTILDFFRASGRFDANASLEPIRSWAEDAGRREPLSLELRQGDGSVLDVFAQATPDRGFVISFTDVTAERRAIEALHRANETLETRVAERTLELDAARMAAERANASKSRFLAAASHDLLQPLSAAKLFLSSLRGTGLAPDQHALVGRIHSAFESVEGILGALLDMSKLETGVARTEVEALPLADLFTTLADEFRPLARAKGIDLRFVASGAWVESDRLYLRRILGNLVSNAIRYTARGKVLIGARRLVHAVRIEVCDTGPGIPPDKTAEIFREFIRLGGGGGSGVGLGLAIVDQACALLGHPLAVRSRLGRGSVFSVEVSRAAPVAATDRLPRAEAPVGPLDDMIVLIVENDREVRAGMVGLLESWGASPLDADDLAGARALVADIGVAPDVVIADYHLDAETDGLAVIEALRADSPGLPAVVITADRAADLRPITEAASILLLHKPVPVHQLRLVLQQLKLQQSAPTPLAPARPGDRGYWLGSFLDAD